MAIIEEIVKRCRCERCGHVWTPNNVNNLPKVCTACNTPLWNIPKGQPKTPKKI